MIGVIEEPQNMTSENAISGGDLVVSLYEIWGSRWLVDRLLSFAKENDWLEFKATLCPPKESKFQEYYSGERDNSRKYVKGDYYLQVVKAVISLINSHGGALLLGIAQPGNGLLPKPSDYECLCESKKYMPVLFNSQYSEWDTDAWLLYVKNIFRANEWIDRYGTTWNCTEILDDQYIRLYNGILHGQPVAVIAVFPTDDLPVELKRSVYIGRYSRKHKNNKPPDHCIRRAKSGGSCHWPHNDPVIEQVVVPLRLRGDVASVDIKESYAEVAKIWASREPLQNRFFMMAQEERSTCNGFPFGLRSALESVLFYTLSRSNDVTSRSGAKMSLNNCRIRRESKDFEQIHPQLELMQHAHAGCYTWLTGSEMAVVSSITATLCKAAANSYKWGEVIPVYVRLPTYLDKSLLNYLFEKKKDFIPKYLLPRLASSASTTEHWYYLANTFGLHLVVDNIGELKQEIVTAFLRSVRHFRDQFFRSFTTIVSRPNEAHKRPYYERIELTKDKP
jgi:hypothetical protein